MSQQSSVPLMRDYINKTTVEELAGRIKKTYPRFNQAAFIQSISSRLKKLGLNERLDLVAKGLEQFLPVDFSKSAHILIRSLGPPLEESSSLDGVDLGSNNGFIVIALTNYVAERGQEHFDLSMKALKEMTLRFSSEMAIRHFIVNHEKKVLKTYKSWVKHANVHVRRLVSESLRPRLPWAIRLQKYVKDPSPILPYLEALKEDPELYVRRSVANNLNDISKDHPNLVIATLKKWADIKTKEMEWIIQHATRTLVKQGHPGALILLGYPRNPKIEVSDIQLKQNVIHLGDTLEFEFDIQSTSGSEQKLLIDYIIYFKKANGLLSPKVFKLTSKTLKAKQSISIRKKHPIRKITTRRYYNGQQKVRLQVNGKIYNMVSFELKITGQCSL